VKVITARLAALAAGLALFAGMAMAQDQTAPPAAGGNRMHAGMRGGFMGGPGLGLALQKLNLTPEQKTQIQQIFHNQKSTFAPLRAQKMAAQMEMMKLITSGNFDQGKAASIAAQQSQIDAQLNLAFAKAASEIYQNVLTSDQKNTAAAMVAEHANRMQQRINKNGESAQPNQ